MEANNNYCQVIPGTEVRIGERYQHYKGKIYVVDGFALHTETNETLVLYHREDETHQTYARPFSMFIEVIDTVGTRRFKAMKA